MKLSANQAAKEAGIAKKTLLEAIKSGRLSAEKNGKGHWEIDTSELFRVFSKTDTSPVTKTETHPLEKPPETSALQVEVKMLREMLEGKDELLTELRQDRDDWKGQAKTSLIANQNVSEAAKSTRRGLFGLFSSKG